MNLKRFFKGLICLAFFLAPSFLFTYDLSVESIYLSNLKCELHFVLKNSGDNIPDSVFNSGKVSIKISSIRRKISFSLNQIDPKKELNYKKQVAFNTKHKLKKDEKVEVALENIKDINPLNNSKTASLSINLCIKRESEEFDWEPKREEKLIDHDPFEKHFQFKINGISPPKSVYVYDSLPPTGNIEFSWISSERDAKGIKIEFQGAGNGVLSTIEKNGSSGSFTKSISEIQNFSDSQTRDVSFFNVKSTLKLGDGKYSKNSKVIKLWINLKSKYYYYQDYASRGVQVMKINGSMGPVLIAGLNEDDREGKMEMSYQKNRACPQDYPILKNPVLKFFTTSEEGRGDGSASYSINLSESQTSYSFSMKNIIQNCMECKVVFYISSN